MIREAEVAGFGFLQKESENQMVKKDRANLDPNKLYLETASILHQIFIALHLDEIRTTENTLHGLCNSGTTTIRKKGMYLHLFDMCLVQNGIDNLLLVPRLEREGFA